MTRNILVDVELIVLTTILSLAGVDPTPFFVEKYQDTTLTNRMKDKYELTRHKRGFAIISINDMNIWFTAKVLSNKLLRKM